MQIIYTDVLVIGGGLAGQRAAIGAMRRVLETIRRDGHAGAMVNEMASFKDRELIVDTARYLEAGERFGT